MKSSDFEALSMHAQPAAEAIPVNRRDRSKIRPLGAITISVLSVAGSLSAMQAPSGANEKHQTVAAKPAHAPKHAHNTHQATKPHHHKKTKTTLTTTPTTVSPEISRPSDQFLGAIELVRKGADETDKADATVYHRLNAATWVTRSNVLAVDPLPMLNYGGVYNQSTAPFGTLGQTTLVSEHDVTALNAPVTVDGHTYNQREATASANAAPVYSNAPLYSPVSIQAANEGHGNMDTGDEIVVYLNNPNNTETIDTYTITNRYIINPTDNTEVQALANPPSSPNVSQLTYYDCWPSHTADYREVFNATLTSTNTAVGNVTFTGTQAPNFSTVNQ